MQRGSSDCNGLRLYAARSAQHACNTGSRTDGEARASLGSGFGENGGVHRFFRPEEVKEFTSREREFYLEVSRDGAVPADLRNQLNALLGQPDNVADQLPKKPELAEQIKSQLLGAFASAGVPISTTPAGQLIRDLLEKEGPQVAAAALMYLANLGGSSLAKSAQFRGAFAAAAFEAGVNPKQLTAMKRSMESLAATFNGALAESASQVQEQRARFQEAEHRVRRFTWLRAVRQARALRKAAAAQRGEISEALSSLATTKATYESFMQLRGPVEYWKTKAEEHRNRAKGYRTLLLRFAGIAGTGLLIGLIVLGKYAIGLASSPKEQPAALFVILGAIGVVGTAMIFWAARVLVRLFMSEHHVRPLPLLERRKRLSRAVRRAPEAVRLSEHLDGPAGPAMYRHACGMSLEGIVSKRVDRPYRSGRCAHWLKIRNTGYERRGT